MLPLILPTLSVILLPILSVILPPASQTLPVDAIVGKRGSGGAAPTVPVEDCDGPGSDTSISSTTATLDLRTGDQILNGLTDTNNSTSSSGGSCLDMVERVILLGSGVDGLGIYGSAAAWPIPDGPAMARGASWRGTLVPNALQSEQMYIWR